MSNVTGHAAAVTAKTTQTGNIVVYFCVFLTSPVRLMLWMCVHEKGY